jgi:hypothetical protein
MWAFSSVRKGLLILPQTVLFHFGAQEDAITAKVDDFKRDGAAVVDTLIETWQERMRHERKVLKDGLKAEKDMVINALGVLEHGQGDEDTWSITLDDDMLRETKKRNGSLLESIQALIS